MANFLTESRWFWIPMVSIDNSKFSSPKIWRNLSLQRVVVLIWTNLLDCSCRITPVRNYLGRGYSTEWRIYPMGGGGSQTGVSCQAPANKSQKICSKQKIWVGADVCVFELSPTLLVFYFWETWRTIIKLNASIIARRDAIPRTPGQHKILIPGQPNPWSAEVFLYKLWRPRVFFNLKSS